jgi:hypothetical protein
VVPVIARDALGVAYIALYWKHLKGTREGVSTCLPLNVYIYCTVAEYIASQLCYILWCNCFDVQRASSIEKARFRIVPIINLEKQMLPKCARVRCDIIDDEEQKYSKAKEDV